MHGKYVNGGGCPMADARMAALGESHPDFSGPGYGAAKQMLIVVGPEVESSDQPDAETVEAASPHDVLKDIAGQLEVLGVPAPLVTQMQDAVAALAADGPPADPDDATDRLTSGDPMD